MTTVSTISETLEVLFPAVLAESWDNTGLLLGRRDKCVARGMTALTLTEDVAEEAVRKNIDLIVVHHPILFRGAKQLTDACADGRVVLRLAESQIAVYSPHTRFDSAAGGINHYLAERLTLTNIRPVRALSDDGAEDSLGAGRIGELAAELSVAEFAEVVAAVCHVPGLHVVDGGRPVTRVAVACGAAGEFLDDAIRLDCDAFVVGECRFHSALQARDTGVSLFVPGHYGTERPAVEWLAEELSRKMDGVSWFPSEVETDPLSWVPRV